MIKASSLQLNYNSIIITLLFVYLGIVYFSVAIANIVLGLSLFTFILAIFTHKIQLDFKRRNWYLYLSIIMPFLLTIVSVLYSNNIIKGSNYLWLRIPVLIVPFIIIFMNIKNDSIKTGLKFFTILTVVAALVTVYNAIRYINEDILFKTDFVFFITIIQHPYLGVFILLTLISIIEFKLIKSKPLKVFVLTLLIITIALTTSRLVYMLFLLISGFYLLKKYSRKHAVFIMILLSVFSVVFILSNEKIKSKFQNSFQYENSPRLKLWDNSYRVITSNNILFGIGIGDYYQDKKDPYFFKESPKGTFGYNPHSQVLEFFITNGLLGILVLLVIIFFGVKNIKNQNNFAVISFGIILAFSLTECILTRQFGVQLYSLFIPLIFTKNFKKLENEI